MQARSGNKTSITFSVQKSDPARGHLILANPDWQSLAQQRSVRVDVLINGKKQYLRPVPTVSGGGESGIAIPFGKGYLRQVFTEKATLAVFYNSKELQILYLHDATTQAAFQAVRECVGDRHDPFAGK